MQVLCSTEQIHSEKWVFIECCRAKWKRRRRKWIRKESTTNWQCCRCNRGNKGIRIKKKWIERKCFNSQNRGKKSIKRASVLNLLSFWLCSWVFAHLIRSSWTFSTLKKKKTGSKQHAISHMDFLLNNTI